MKILTAIEKSTGTIVRLNAATGSAGPLSVITTSLAEPINVVDVSIDARGIREPLILLNFTSTINLLRGISVTLNFQISRTKDDGAPVSVGSTYTFSTLVDILQSEAFGFQFFDSDLAPGVYTYSIQVSTNSVIDITPGLTVTNATLSALAIDDN